jgi:O-methyltransferase
MRAGKRTIGAAVLASARRVPLVRGVLEYLHKNLDVQSYEDAFIANGKSSPYDRNTRAALVERFRRIDRHIDIRTTPSDGLFMAEALLSMNAEGDLVECGCFTGGSTAKLSILAKLLGRRLFVFDSFEGLPAADDYNMHDLHMTRSLGWVGKNPWRAGDYASRLEAVRANVTAFGEIAPCAFVKGWFDQTLDAHLPRPIAFAFTDVDLPSSARECLVHIWPRLSMSGVFFSHDVPFIKVLQEFHDATLWTKALGEWPPIFFGAGFGMCDASPHLGFAVKGRATAEYIKSLTCKK